MRRRGFGLPAFALAAAGLALTLLLCVCVGSVSLPLADTARVLIAALCGLPAEGAAAAIVLSVRLPRALCVMLVGASLSLCGAAMQGLLRNPLADGSTLGVSSGASLGAVLALFWGMDAAAAPMAMAFGLASLLAILSLAYALDRSLSTSSIILIGMIFTMFVSSLLNLIIAFAGERLRTITFWTMGSLASGSYRSAALLAAALAVFGGALLAHARELNAFAIGEESARNVGVHVQRAKLTVLVCVSALIGVCVSVGGVIGFVGLVVPHITRMLAGPNHGRLLPASMLLGAAFLLLCDLAARTLLSPIELPIGVVTSLIGAGIFVLVFWRARKAG